MSYGTPSFGDVTFSPGASVLLTGEAAGTRGLLYDAVADGLAEGESAVVITTNDAPERVVAALDDRTDLDPERLALVDATGEGEDTRVDGITVRAVGSTGDLTGLSLAFAKQLKLLEERGSADRVRVGLDSVSTLLMYSEVQTVFRFLHVFTSRLGSADLFGLFTLTPGMHDDQETNTVRTLFDSEAAVSDDEVALRGSGYASPPSD
ncbi:DUF7504 family protein [Halosegnis marinus]|uniref:Recombinase RecA n=1 Tax=Halosegnis marinus TaxID=3034023 RepID=A0ABD5ZKL6_9EURY|nr:hypothetical protein [Halosegnis sp. DT85]